MFLPLLAASLIVLTAGSFLAWYVDHVLTVAPDRLWDARIMLGLLLFSAAVTLPLGPFCVGLYVRQRFVLSNLIELGAAFLRTGLLLALLFGVSTRVLWIVVATVSAGTIQAIVTLTISRRMVPALRFRLDQVDWTMGKKVMGFGGWSVISNIGGLLQRTLDPILLNKLGTAMDVTCYHLGTMPLRHIWLFTAAAVSPLQPQLTAMHAIDSREQLRNAYLRGCRYGLWVVLFVTLPVIIYRKELITLYVGQKYLGASGILALTLAAGSYGFCNWFLPQIAHAKGQMKPLAVRAAFLQLVRLLLVIYFVGWRHMGAMGMALSTFYVTFIGGSLLCIPLGWRFAGVSGRTWFKEVILRGGFPGLAATIVWVGLRAVIRPDSWTSLGLYTAVGCVLYIAVLVLYCFKDYEREQLRTVKARIIPTRASG